MAKALREWAGALAMLALQSDRYTEDSAYREAVDMVLALVTQDSTEDEKAEPQRQVRQVEMDLRDSSRRLKMCADHWREFGEPDGDSDYGIRLMEFTAERIDAGLAEIALLRSERDALVDAALRAKGVEV